MDGGVMPPQMMTGNLAGVPEMTGKMMGTIVGVWSPEEVVVIHSLSVH